jgi:endoglucanase
MKQRQKGQIAIISMLMLTIISMGGIIHAITATHAAPNVAKIQTPLATPTPVTPTATPLPPVPALSVQGTQFVNADGTPVTLIGATRQSLEYLCNGDGHFQPADFQAMRSWGMNTVRITISSEFWAGAGGNCPNYHQTVAEAVINAESVGMYVILALQWDAPFDTQHDRIYGGVQCPMPDNQKDVGMWRDLAQIYRYDQRVIFDVFSEPHDVGWNTWLNGGTISGAACYIISQQNNQTETGTYHAIGMRDLVAAVRAISLNTIIIVSGLDWGYNLSNVGADGVLSGNNIVYSTHPFNYGTKAPAYWPQDFGTLAQKQPVIAAEFGSYDCGTSYIADAIAYFNAHHISWLAWAWNVGNCGGPSLLASWSGTPTSPYGTYIRQQMQAMNP